MFLSENLRKCREWVGGQGLLTHTGTALHALVGAWRAEHAAQSVWAEWADEAGGSLAWAADWALGRVALEHWAYVSLALDVVDAHTWHTGGVLATGITGVLAHLAHHLGADRAGDLNVSVSVLDVHSRALGVLVVLGLGGVLDALDGLDDVLARRGLVDHATTNIKKIGRIGGGRGGHLFVITV
jgi:hypothetical protein